MSANHFRVLSIDGGGVRGYLAASVLANIEDYLNSQTGEKLALGRRFDFIAGTSTGGLIALALALGLPAATVRDLYTDLLPKVFGSANKRNSVVHLKRPGYYSRPLQIIVEAFYLDKTLADLVCDACITSVALESANPRMHKTDYLKRNSGRLDTRLSDIALSTTAAPTYFSAHSSKNSANLIDGGIVANNPAMVALVDALQFERPSKRGTPPPQLGPNADPSLLMLSIGTGQPGPMPYDYLPLINGGIADWVAPIYEVMMLSQSTLVHHQAAFMLGEKYTRVNPTLNFAVKLDDWESALELRNKADIDKTIEEFLLRYFC